VSNYSFDFDSPPEDSPPRADDRRALPRELILASAGSGKTYRISSRIIGLLARGEPADSIFASTFTRKAAGEITERVLTRLARAAVSLPQAVELAGAVALAGGARPSEDPAYWQDLLERVVSELHRLNIGTLDAFFIRSARSFAHDLGLPPAWRIIDEATADALRADALSDVLRDHDAATLVSLVRAQAREAVTRSVHAGLLRDAQKLVDIHRALHPESVDPWSAFAAAFSPISEAECRERCAALATRLRQARLPAKRDGSPNSQWQKAVRDAADRLERGDFEALLASGLATAALNEGGTYNRTIVPDEISALFAEIVPLVRATFGPRYAAQVVAKGRLAALLADALERRRRESGGYGFDDITRLLGGPDPLGERPDLYYRLDMRTRHLLLDEFQDTSLPQWEALEPLVDELLAGHQDERAAVIVADPKQSIYGWRGASPLLVRRVGERYALEQAKLVTSWRSSQVVLDAVNAIFAAVESLPVWRDNADDIAAARQWRAEFEPHIAEKALPGFVELRVGPFEDTRKDERPGLCHEAAQLAARLHGEAPHRSVGILMRTNAGVARVMYELGRLGVDASEEGGVPLIDAAPVSAILALLQLADHPGDTLARYHVAHSPLGALVGLTDSGDAGGACELAQRTRRRLLEDGYGATLADLAHGLRAACDAREQRRLGQLVELAFRYDADASLRPIDFITRVAAERVEDATASQVRVMTVHQAKGLEFDAVILPQLDPALRRVDNTLLPLRADSGAGRVMAVYPYIRTALRPIFAEALPGMLEAARQRDAARLRDSLSALYVAVTRARHALYMIVAPDSRSRSNACTAAMLVRDALAKGQLARPAEVLYSHGSEDWAGELDVLEADARAPAARSAPTERSTPVSAASGGAPLSTASRGALLSPSPDGIAPMPDSSPPRLVRRGAPRSRSLPRRSPSELEGETRIEVRNLLRIDASAAAMRGTIVHAWFEALSWIEAGPPPDDELRSIARRVAPRVTDDEVDTLLRQFRAWLGTPEIRAALSRSHAGDGPVLERELRFLRREGDVVMEGVIDRLVLRRDATGAASAEILDFKTDAIAAGDATTIRERTGFYRPQMDAYRGAVAANYGIEDSAVRARLIFLEPGVVVEVDEIEGKRGVR
jgi:ATP-dependent helicase/nuclease subunit A